MTSATFIDPKSVAGKPLALAERTPLLVIGGGPAGLSAAIAAAEAGLEVICVDENPVPPATMGEDVPLHFGQSFTAATRNRNAVLEAVVASEPLIERAFEAGVDLRLGTAAWGLYANGPSVGWMPAPVVVGLADESHSWLVACEHVIVAAGRRDMGLALDGWSLPGVLGATAARVLAERYQALAGRRAVVLGSTTDALAAARTLASAGVEIAAIVEQAEEPVGDREWLAALRRSGCEILPGHVPQKILGRDSVEGIVLARQARPGEAAGEQKPIACDLVLLGVGAVPVIDLLDAAGCRIVLDAARGGHVPVLEGQRCSQPAIWAAGDCAGIWPAKTRDRAVAEAEGRRAVAAVIASSRGATGADTLPEPHATAPDPEHDIGAYRLAWVAATVLGAQGDPHVCQCEEVSAREILEVRPPRYLGAAAVRRNDRNLASLLGAGPPNPDIVKRLTRAGMGSCQGRRCREQVAALLALGAGTTLAEIPLAGYRAPVRPLPLSLLADHDEPAAMAAHWDSWFGMHAQWRPFWDVPAHYTVADNRSDGPVASE